MGLASEPIPPPDQAQAWLVCTLTHPEGSSGSTYITGNISGGLCSLYCDGIRLEIIAFLLLFFPASLVEFLKQKPEKQQCLVTSATTRPLDCSIPPSLLCCTDAYITHCDLVYSGEQDVWSVRHDMNAGLVFVPLLSVQPL